MWLWNGYIALGLKFSTASFYLNLEILSLGWTSLDSTSVLKDCNPGLGFPQMMQLTYSPSILFLFESLPLLFLVCHCPSWKLFTDFTFVLICEMPTFILIFKVRCCSSVHLISVKAAQSSFLCAPFVLFTPNHFSTVPLIIPLHNVAMAASFLWVKHSVFKLTFFTSLRTFCCNGLTLSLSDLIHTSLSCRQLQMPQSQVF